jgi:hypothetical protein
MSSLKKHFVVMEERATLSQDTPLDDFAHHFYYTRYTKMKGVVMESFENLCVDFQNQLEILKKKHTSASLREIQATGHSPLVWSMNWYSLRSEGKTTCLSWEERLTLEKMVYDMEEEEDVSYDVFILPPVSGPGIVLVAVAVRLVENTAESDTCPSQSTSDLDSE